LKILPRVPGARRNAFNGQRTDGSMLSREKPDGKIFRKICFLVQQAYTLANKKQIGRLEGFHK
jgi:hypothetical protein